MSWLAKLWSMFFGGGGIVSAVDDGLKLADDVTHEVHDHNERVAGETKIIATDNAASAKVNENVAKAAVDTSDAVALDKLRDGTA